MQVADIFFKKAGNGLGNRSSVFALQYVGGPAANWLSTFFLAALGHGLDSVDSSNNEESIAGIPGAMAAVTFPVPIPRRAAVILRKEYNDDPDARLVV